MSEQALDDEYSKSKLRKLEKKYVSNETYKMRMMDGKLTEITKRISLFHFIHLLLLVAVDLIFLLVISFLLKQQHDPQRPMSELLISGDIVFTPPIYICNIDKTFSPVHKGKLLPTYELRSKTMFEWQNTDLYDTDAAFRKTLAGLRVKAEMSCDQTDSACTVSKYFEKVSLCLLLLNVNLTKTCILCAMLAANVFGVAILLIEVLRNATKLLKPTKQNLTQKCTDDVLLMPTNNMPW